MLAIDTKFKVQMGSSGPTCCAHQSNGLTLVHILPTLDQHFAQVGIDRAVTVAVLDDHGIAVTTHVASTFHHTQAHISNRRALRGRVIHPQMGSPGLENRMQAHAETAGHSGKSKWRSQVGAAQTLPTQVVITAWFVSAGLEPHGLVSLVLVDEFSAQDLARFQGFTISLQSFVADREAVTFAK